MELVERLRSLEELYRGRLALEEVGRSVQGRSIHLVTLGSGPRRTVAPARGPAASGPPQGTGTKPENTARSASPERTSTQTSAAAPATTR